MLKHAMVVFRKELIDIFRDRKTIIASIIIPALALPLLLTIMNMTNNKSEETAKENIKVSVVSEDKNKNLESFLKSRPNIVVVQSKQPDEDLKSGKIQAVIELDKDFTSRITEEEQTEVTVKYDETSSKSSLAYAAVEEVIREYIDGIVVQRLQERDIDPQIIHPAEIVKKSITVNEEKGMGIFLLTFFLPFVLVTWTTVGATPAAVDLGAGEKERGTLEPLLTTKPRRSALVLGKYMATVTASIIGTLASLSGFSIMIAANPEFLPGGLQLSIGSVAIMALVSFLLSLIFSALLLTISIYARSTKEAGTYIAPITILIMIPSYITMFTDVKNIPDYMFHIPVLSAVLLIKESLFGVYKIYHILVTLGWSFVFIILALYLANRAFKKEKVIFRS